jgi:class 3 adenylate cyclase
VHRVVNTVFAFLDSTSVAPPTRITATPPASLASRSCSGEHFRLLQEIIGSENGAVVKTIGDAVMATFETPDRAVAAAIRMRKATSDLGAQRQHQSLHLKIGIHEGSCLAVTLNDQQDYFGQTVNIASRVQGLAASRAIVVTEQVVENTQASMLLESTGLKPTLRRATLSGIADEMSVYEIP